MHLRRRTLSGPLRAASRQGMLDHIRQATSPLARIRAATAYLQVETSLAGADDARTAAEAAADGLVRVADTLYRRRTGRAIRVTAAENRGDEA